MANLTSFKELKCWQACKEAKLWTYKMLNNIDTRDYDLKQNLRRAARSTTRNIAEGYGRFHYKENIQYCRISRGSLYEMLDNFDDLHSQNHISEDQMKEGEEKVLFAIKVLNGYIKYLSGLTK